MAKNCGVQGTSEKEVVIRDVVNSDDSEESAQKSCGEVGGINQGG